jgi:hypothetical protein
MSECSPFIHAASRQGEDPPGRQEPHVPPNLQAWETLLRELTRLAETFPSRRVFLQLAECYTRLGEHAEARVISALAEFYRDDPPSA